MPKLNTVFVILSVVVLGLPTTVAAQTTPPGQTANAVQTTPPGQSQDTAQTTQPARTADTAQTAQPGQTPVTAQTTPLAQTPDTAQVVVQQTEVTLDGRLTFGGVGFVAGEGTTITVEDDQGGVQARLEPLAVDATGQIATVSVAVPGGLAPGPHTLHITGLSSQRFGHAAFQLQWQPPTVHLDAYTGKPTHHFSFSGSGFVPGEQVDVFLDNPRSDSFGSQASEPLASVAADPRGELASHELTIPQVAPGDYRLAFVGRTSHAPVSVGFNVQGFHPWAVLDNYSIAPHQSVGFEGQDFVPGEVVQVYLNSRLSQPVAQATADAQGHFALHDAFELPDLVGHNQLIFVGQQSQTEVTATFAAATSAPRPATPE